jgi:CRP-like cAMP-binding protein
MVEVAECQEGASFGELALLKQKPRTATIHCKENTHCAVLDKASYKQVISAKQDKTLNEKIELLK